MGITITDAPHAMTTVSRNKSQYGKNIKNVSKGHNALLSIDHNMNVKANVALIHKLGIFKIKTMFFQICQPFAFVPFVIHSYYITTKLIYVNQNITS